MNEARYVIMGVAGCGKSLIGAALAPRINATYRDGDDLHPPENIAKMSRGEPLDDADRWPWLDRVADALVAATGPIIIGCSALKRVYRDRIRAIAGEDVIFIHLSGARDLIEKRMATRDGHFMPVSLLDSQFAALQPPARDERHVSVDITGSPDKVVARIIAALGSRSDPS